MDFEKRLHKAIERGKRISEARSRAEEAKAVTEEELHRLHSQYRLDLSERIEGCIKRLPEYFPGFRFKSVVGENGWGCEVRRDDVGVGSGGRRANFFSRLEMTVRPFNRYHVLELAAKGTIRNKEVFSRTHYERLEEADLTTFHELIDFWTLEFAELYAAKQ